MAKALATSELAGVATALFAGIEESLQCWTRGTLSSSDLQAVCCAAPAYALMALQRNLKEASEIASLLDSLRQCVCKQVSLISRLTFPCTSFH